MSFKVSLKRDAIDRLVANFPGLMIVLDLNKIFD